VRVEADSGTGQVFALFPRAIIVYMDLLRRIYDYFLDFLFPRSERVKILEQKARSKTLRSLPTPHQSSDWVMTLFAYKNPLVRELIWQIKYKKNTILLNAVAEIFYEECQAILEEKTGFGNLGFILIPIPMLPDRKRERGWNQTELLTETIVKLDNEKIFIHSPRTLSRVKRTAPQTTLRNRKMRLENMRGVFSANDQDVNGKNVILVDDVTTTGATLIEASRTLLSAGAKEVFCLTIAH
jgi:ComF family protein